MQFSVYGVIDDNSRLWHGEIERDEFSLCSSMTVESMTRRGEMRRDGANHQEKLGLREFDVRVNVPCVIQQVQGLIQRVITPI
jgi:hypothetical protein